MAEIVAHSGLLKDTKVHVEDTGGRGRPVVQFGVGRAIHLDD